MRLRASLAGALASAALLAGAMPVAASPTACVGSGQIWPVEAPQVRVADGTTFIDFDFGGVHPICLADGTLVPAASVSGHVWQRIDPDGSIFVRFHETLTYDGGELQYRGNATFNASGWQSAVRTVGSGTGPLAGIVGHGTFSPISADGAFTDEIFYTYR